MPKDQMSTSISHPTVSATTAIDGLERSTMRKVMLRIVPILFLSYFIAYLDRINIGFAALGMNHDLGLSSVDYGWAAGLFFLTYVVFEIPSNLVLERVGRATIRIDVNQGWDEHTARRFLSPLEQAGVALVEQPLPRWNVAGMARLKTSTAMSVMADEGVASSHDAIAHVQAAAADTFALKVTKSGGYAETRRIAAIAAGAGLALYGGCMLETGIGTAAYLQLFATLPSMKWGCELFGPRLLENDIVTSPPAMKDFAIHLPDSYGTGVEIDEDKLNFYRRDRSRSAQAKA